MMTVSASCEEVQWGLNTIYAVTNKQLQLPSNYIRKLLGTIVEEKMWAIQRKDVNYECRDMIHSLMWFISQKREHKVNN